MKTQHTPAQWQAHNGQIYGQHDGKTIAIMIDRDNEANAALICAAPDLLAACKVALQCAEDEYPESSQDDYGVFKVLRNAIKKAEGN